MIVPVAAVLRSPYTLTVFVAPGARVKFTEKLFVDVPENPDEAAIVAGLIGVEPDPEVSSVERFEMLVEPIVVRPKLTW